MRKIIFQLSVSLLLLGYFATQIDWSALFVAFKDISITYYLISMLTAIVGSVIMSGKYHLLIKHTSLGVPFLRVIAINFIARFYALFLPSALGPGAVRWYKITKNKKGKSFFLASTIVERVFFILVLFVCGSMPLFLSQDPAIQSLASKLWPLLAGLSACFVLMLMYFLWPALHKTLKDFFIERLRLVSGSRLHGFLDNFSLQNASPRVVGMLFLLTVVWQISFLIRMYFLFVSQGLPFGFWDVTWMSSLVLLLQIIPASFAGLGVREGAFAFLFSLHDVQAEAGVVLGMLFFSQMLISCFVGWMCQLCEKGEKNQI